MSDRSKAACRPVHWASWASIAIGLCTGPGSSASGGEPAELPRRILTHDGREKTTPLYSDSEGQKILYVVQETRKQVRLMTFDLKTGQSEPLHPAEKRNEFEPALSRDGKFLAYVQNWGNLSLGMVIENRTTGEKHELPPEGGFSGMRSPTFTADSRRVVYSYPDGTRQQLFSVDLQGKNRQTILDQPGITNFPTLSADGESLYFAATIDQGYDLYSARSDGTATRRLTIEDAQDLRPALSPDGRWLAFTSNRDGNYELYLMRTDGSDIHRITNHPERDDYASWHPDGKHLIYVAERDGAQDLVEIDVLKLIAG